MHNYTEIQKLMTYDIAYLYIPVIQMFTNTYIENKQHNSDIHMT